MEIDGGQGVLAIELQQEGTQSAAVNASRARESNGEVHSAPERPVKQGVTKLPDQVAAGPMPVQQGFPYNQAKSAGWYANLKFLSRGED